jgi:hypothetical protein
MENNEKQEEQEQRVPDQPDPQKMRRAEYYTSKGRIEDHFAQVLSDFVYEFGGSMELSLKVEAVDTMIENTTQIHRQVWVRRFETNITPKV